MHAYVQVPLVVDPLVVDPSTHNIPYPCTQQGPGTPPTHKLHHPNNDTVVAACIDAGSVGC